ncbi:12 kDa heat shock protein [Monosporozyma unispora]|nr:lipid-binding protein hsp12 [Kazachstania unispora]
MSDAGRKDFSDKAKESLKPDSQKGYMEKGKEYVTDAADKVAGAAQPEKDKGVFQGASDAADKGKDKAKAQNIGEESYGEQAKEYLDSAKTKLNDAVEYVSNSLHGGDDPKK